jgi:hypothetical protein
MGLILVQVPKQSPHKSIVVFDNGVNLNNSNIKFQQHSLVVGHLTQDSKTHQLYKANKVFGYDGELGL